MKPFPPEWTHGFRVPDESAMRQRGGEMADLLPPNTTLGLRGALGVGKTTFAKGFAATLGVRQTVKSPTYNYYLTYHTPTRLLLHLDAYRMRSPEEYDSLLLEDLLDPPWTLLVEWPENILSALPRPYLQLEFSGGPEEERYLRLYPDPGE